MQSPGGGRGGRRPAGGQPTPPAIPLQDRAYHPAGGAPLEIPMGPSAGTPSDRMQMQPTVRKEGKKQRGYRLTERAVLC